MSVYFIKPIGMDGPIKIGCSKSPEKRMNGLELWSPFPLEIAAICEGDGALERQFHALFAADHIRHEWFTSTPALQSVIAQLTAGTFDFGELPEPRHLPRKAKDLSYITPEWRALQSIQCKNAYAYHRARRAAS